MNDKSKPQPGSGRPSWVPLPSNGGRIPSQDGPRIERNDRIGPVRESVIDPIYRLPDAPPPPPPEDKR